MVHRTQRAERTHRRKGIGPVRKGQSQARTPRRAEQDSDTEDSEDEEAEDRLNQLVSRLATRWTEEDREMRERLARLLWGGEKDSRGLEKERERRPSKGEDPGSPTQHSPAQTSLAQPSKERDPAGQEKE